MPRGQHQPDRNVLQLQQETTREEDKHKRRTKAVEDELAEEQVFRGKGTSTTSTITLCKFDLAEGEAYSVTASIDGQRRDASGDAQFHITAGVRRLVGAGAVIVGQTVTNYGSVWTGIITVAGNTVSLTAVDGTGAVVDWTGEMRIKAKTARKAAT